MSKKIYIADDELNIRELIKSFLEADGFQVEAFETGDDLWDAFEVAPSDMVILDISMPGTDGLNICNKIRSKSIVPIIIVSARDSELDRITGLTLGSDDYLTKPFSMIELVARVKSLFRRIEVYQEKSEKDILKYGNLVINSSAKTTLCNDSPLELTPTEFAFITYLIVNKEKAISREELLKNVWKFDVEVDTRATDDVVKRLRKKLINAGSTAKIESVWGFGFKISLEEGAHEKTS